MKLLRFTDQNELGVKFGFTVNNEVFAFSDFHSSLNEKKSKKKKDILLSSPESYLAGLPASHEHACAVIVNAEKAEKGRGRAFSEVRLLAPLGKIAGLFDFGLTPRHLINSAHTMFRHEFGAIAGRIASAFIARKIRKKAKQADLAYYKGNHQVLSGPRDDIVWPLYTSYLDIEPELAIITGNREQPIAGYCIFNDISARDVQFPEMIGSGPARSKDFSASNCMGPFLLTADELPNPLNLNVSVEISNRFSWTGSTSEYICDPKAVLDYLNTVFPPAPGTVIGMGTVPGCTGMDNNKWLCPGDVVTIIFDKLGSIVQKVLAPAGKLQESRWKKRKELSPYY